MTNPAELLLPEWTIIPRKPWVVRLPDGRAFKRFDSCPDAMAWLRRHGYGE